MSSNANVHVFTVQAPYKEKFVPRRPLLRIVGMTIGNQGAHFAPEELPKYAGGSYSKADVAKNTIVLPARMIQPLEEYFATYTAQPIAERPHVSNCHNLMFALNGIEFDRSAATIAMAKLMKHGKPLRRSPARLFIGEVGAIGGQL